MNFESQGTPIAIIKTNKTKKPPIICVDDKHVAHHSFPEFQLPHEDEFQQIPNPLTERSISYVTGASGSGKSYYIKNYANEFKKMYPKRDIYLFSSISDDSSIDKVKGLKRVKLSPELLQDEITAEDFKNSLVIFDDCDCITDKKMKQKVQAIQNSILETGRHFNVFCCISSHLPCAGNETKRTLNEAHSITFFPHSLGGRSLKYLLESYLGLDKEQIQKIKSTPSRWVTVIKTYPQVVLTEKEIYTISHKK
jgi:Cdc6-like AAA superfamily ATPase